VWVRPITHLNTWRCGAVTLFQGGCVAMKKSYIWTAVLLIVSSLVPLSGCKDDDPVAPAPAQTGTVVIDPSPDTIDVPWELVGPSGYSEDGTGDVTLSKLDPGDYTVTWGDITDWITPVGETKALSAGATATFTCNYTEIPVSSGDFVFIPPGSFLMGCPEGEPGRQPGEVQHLVTLSHGFFILKYEVTQQYWADVMGGEVQHGLLAKGSLTWDDAVEFCNALSAEAGLTAAYTIHGPNGDVTWDPDADGYRLPTEAEWEYACRAGSTTAFTNGPIVNTACSPLDPSLHEIGWYCGNSGLSVPIGIKEAGAKSPNAWGLFDMHGNVREWVLDNYLSNYETLPEVDPVHYLGGSGGRILKGGDVNEMAAHCRSAMRRVAYPNFENGLAGFRPARTVR